MGKQSGPVSAGNKKGSRVCKEGIEALQCILSMPLQYLKGNELVLVQERKGEGLINLFLLQDSASPHPCSGNAARYHCCPLFRTASSLLPWSKCSLTHTGPVTAQKPTARALRHH